MSGNAGQRAARRVALRVARRAFRAATRTVELKLLLLGGALLVVLTFGFLMVLVMVGTGANAQVASPTGDPVCTKTAGVTPPPALMPIYRHAATQYELGDDGWSVLAAINGVESDYGRNPGTSSAGAQGWMQFMPATWATYGVDADGDGDKDLRDPQDAIHGAANYLHASGAPGDWERAVFAYNHADWYVDQVLALATKLRGACTPPTEATAPAATTPGRTAKLLPDGTVLAPADAPEQVKQIIAAANAAANKPYVRGGGHGGWALDDSYDCSGLTSYALHAAGFLTRPFVASEFKAWGERGPGTWVTIYAKANGDWRQDHVFLVIAGLRLDTGGGDRHGTAWRAADRTRKRSYVDFVVRHPPGL